MKQWIDDDVSSPKIVVYHQNGMFRSASAKWATTNCSLTEKVYGNAYVMFYQLLSRSILPTKYCHRRHNTTRIRFLFGLLVKINIIPLITGTVQLEAGVHRTFGALDSVSVARPARTVRQHCLLCVSLHSLTWPILHLSHQLEKIISLPLHFNSNNHFAVHSICQVIHFFGQLFDYGSCVCVMIISFHGAIILFWHLQISQWTTKMSERSSLKSIEKAAIKWA